MGRPATGQVLRDSRSSSPTFALRFHALGRRRYLTLGSEAQGWTRAKAEIELENGTAPYRRALLATLVLAGLRISELTQLRWGDVDLAGNRIIIRQSKTPTGVRQIELLAALRDELAAHKARTPDPSPETHVFQSSTGTELAQGNIRRRVLQQATEHASQALAAAGAVPLPAGLTPHKLRHTYASLLVALGVDPGTIVDQLGHTDPAFTLRVYATGCAATPTPSGGSASSWASRTGSRPTSKPSASHPLHTRRCQGGPDAPKSCHSGPPRLRTFYAVARQCACRRARSATWRERDIGICPGTGHDARTAGAVARRSPSRLPRRARHCD